MTTEYNIRFDDNGKDIAASYVYFSRHGRLKIWVNQKLEHEIDWVDWNDAFLNDDAFAKYVLSEINACVGADQ